MAQRLFCDPCGNEMPEQHDIYVDATWTVRARFLRSGSTAEADVCKPCRAKILRKAADSLEADTLDAQVLAIEK